MNKIIWISAAVLSVAACAKNEVVPVNSGENQEITFNVAPKTKADPAQDNDGHKEFGKGNVFASWAYYLPGTVKWDKKDGDNTTDPITPATTPALYIDRAVIANTKPNGADGVWKAKDKTYYWPKNGSLTFFAYSLNKGDLTLDGKNSGFTCDPGTGISGGINMKDNPNTDFLVAEIAKDRTENVKTHFTEGVPTLFRHKLSNIVFKVAAGSYDRTSFKLKSIQFKNIGCFGSYNQVPESFSDGLQSVPYSPYYSQSVEGQNITTTLTEVDKNSVKNWIFVPQRFDDETGEIEVVYEIITEVATEKFVTQTVTKTIKLKELFPKTYDTVDHTKVISEGWEMGKKYTINLTFTLNEILWDPAVQDWDPVTPATDPIVE